jgi:iron(II)-dependent oxidoreductase
LQHEYQHQETIAELTSLIHAHRFRHGKIGNEFPAPLPWHAPASAQFVSFSGGVFEQGFDGITAYDNERPAQRTDVAPFALAAVPVTAFAWTEFMADGGYQRAEIWTEEGWRWREANDVNRPEYWIGHPDGHYMIGFAGVRAIHPSEPASSISHHEAVAFARWAGHRLPTEAEWEFAARGAQVPGRFFPWGDEAPTDLTAAFRRRPAHPTRVGQFPGGQTPEGLLDLAGNVWEWTASPFLPYHGFRAFPYAGYSADHMDGRHYVCRGGSWATNGPILRSAFRNWYVPSYRQGFLGLRLAKGGA